MLVIPKFNIPFVLKETLSSVLELDALGVRFLNESEFRTNSIKKIEEIFLGCDFQRQGEILYFLRECSRSLYMLPAKISEESGPVPYLSLAHYPAEQLEQLILSASQTNLALPAFEVSEESKYLDLFFLAKALLKTHYRGPVFLAKANNIDERLRLNGVLNLVTDQFHSITILSVSKALEELAKHQWHRTRILGLCNPWMFEGVPPNSFAASKPDLK